MLQTVVLYQFDLLQPHLLMDIKGVLAMLGEGDNTKVPDADPLHWKLLCSNYSDVF